MTSIGYNGAGANAGAGQDVAQMLNHKLDSGFGTLGADGQMGNAWASYFGPPNGEIRTNAYDKMKYETYDLPEVYKGRNIFLKETIEGFINEKNPWYTSVCLPYHYTPEMHIRWNEYRFNRTLAGVVPHEGISRLVTSSKRQFESHTIRHGLAFILEHGFMNTEEGKRQYMFNIRGIRDCVQETNNFDVVAALLHARRYDLEWEAKHGMRDLPFGPIAARKVTEWAIVQKSMDGLDIMHEEYLDRLARYHVKPNMWVWHPRMCLYTQIVPQSEKEYFITGPKGEQMMAKSPAAVTNFRGLPVYTTRAFDVYEDELPIQLLNARRQIGEYYIMHNEHSDHSKYKNFMRDIIVYDESIDNWRRVKFAEALEHCNRFTHDGMGFPEPCSDSGDMFNYTDNTGGVRTVKYIGQLRAEHLGAEVAQAIGESMARDVPAGAQDDMRAFANRFANVDNAVPDDGIFTAENFGDVTGALNNFRLGEEATNYLINKIEHTVGAGNCMFFSGGQNKGESLRTNLLQPYRHKIIARPGVDAAQNNSLTDSRGNAVDDTAVQNADQALSDAKASLKRAKDAFKDQKKVSKKDDPLYRQAAEAVKTAEVREQQARETLKDLKQRQKLNNMQDRNAPGTFNEGQKVAGNGEAAGYLTMALWSQLKSGQVTDQNLLDGYGVYSEQFNNGSRWMSLRNVAARDEEYMVAPPGIRQPGKNAPSVADVMYPISSRFGLHQTGYMYNMLNFEPKQQTMRKRQRDINSASDWGGARRRLMADDGFGVAGVGPRYHHPGDGVYGATHHERRNIGNFNFDTWDVTRDDYFATHTPDFAQNFASCHSCTDPFSRVCAMAVMGSFCTGAVFRQMHRQHVVVPLNFLISRPYMTYEMSSGIMMKGGSETGECFVGHTDFQLGDDVVSKMHYGNYTYYSKAIVKDPKNIIIAENIFCQAYLGGNNCKWIKDPSSHSEETFMTDRGTNNPNSSESDERQRPSMISMVIPYTEGKLSENPISLTGYFAQSARDAQPHFSSAPYYRNVWNFSDDDQTDDFNVYGHQQYQNSVCYQGHQFYWREHQDGGGSHTAVTINTGHWGPDVYPGCGKVRRGEMKFLDKQDYTQTPF